jgi:hypothetical protein
MLFEGTIEEANLKCSNYEFFKNKINFISEKITKSNLTNIFYVMEFLFNC